MATTPTEADYAEKFKTRYTDEDQEYMKFINEPLPNPPVFESWIPRRYAF